MVNCLLFVTLGHCLQLLQSLLGFLVAAFIMSSILWSSVLPSKNLYRSWACWLSCLTCWTRLETWITVASYFDWFYQPVGHLVEVLVVSVDLENRLTLWWIGTSWLSRVYSSYHSMLVVFTVHGLVDYPGNAFLSLLSRSRRPFYLYL